MTGNSSPLATVWTEIQWNPVRTAQQVFSTAKMKAGLRKVVSFHSLRHSFLMIYGKEEISKFSKN